MPTETTSEAPLFGYLTVVDDSAHGACGGYLVLNQQGRPVEFHCTAPVSPSRAQQILYGPTLRTSLYGEQIGPALVAKAKSPVAVVFVNQPECLELQRHTGVRVVHLDESISGARSGATGSASAIGRGQDTGTASSTLQRFLFPELELEVRSSAEGACEEVEPLLRLLAEAIDLAEPFERIREAIYEAQQIGGEGQGGDARAA